MVRSFVLGALFFAGSAAGVARSAHAQDVKLGYVDLQRALAETEDGRKARAVLKKDFDQKQKELDEQQEELKKSADDLEKKRTLLPADKVREKEAELTQRMSKVQQVFMRHQQDLAKKEGEATQKIIERMQRIIVRMAQAENFTMVLEKNQSGVVFAKTHLDLTNELIRRYNGGEGAEGGGAKPAAGAAKPAAPAKK